VLEECKSRIYELIKHHKNIHIFDFMRKSPITLEDTNYWDDIHHNITVADELIEIIGEKILGSENKEGYYNYHSS